ncbi:MAG: hypothetical protein Q8L47_00280 [bacterium]|nr:hypothetical protein [bacterium]
MNLLIGIHAALGELGALAFVWVAVELINPTEGRIRRAKIIALIGVIAFFISWVAGGYYYLTNYQAIVKALIKEGPIPWAHTIVTETKEHVFIFLPFMAIVVWGVLKQYGNDLIDSKKSLAKAIMILAAFIALFAFAMAGMGYLISSGARSALEQKVL